MAVTATRSYEDYEKEQIDKAQKYVNEQAAARQQSNAQTLSQIGAAIDKSANTAAGVYQKRIDGADAAYKSQYADNAIDEAFARDQIKNIMAASGMTDSGQNLTTQTAISLQRNNRDAEVTASKRNYVQEMQDAIDAVWADAASQKSAQEIKLQQDYKTFYDNLYANAMSGAQENAVNLYNADLAAQQAAYEAEQQRIADETKSYYDSLVKLSEAADETNANREAYALSMMKNMGYTEEQAWAAAGVRYPTGDQTVDAYNNAYNAAIKSGYTADQATQIATAVKNGGDYENTAARMKAQTYIGDKNVLEGLGGGIDDNFKIQWANVTKGISGAVEMAVNEAAKAIEKDSNYQKASATEKKYMKAYAVGNAVYQYFFNNSQLKFGKYDAMTLLEAMPENLDTDQLDVIRETLGLKG